MNRDALTSKVPEVSDVDFIHTRCMNRGPRKTHNAREIRLFFSISVKIWFNSGSSTQNIKSVVKATNMNSMAQDVSNKLTLLAVGQFLWGWQPF